MIEDNIRIPSDRLTAQENLAGINEVYYTMKLSYIKLKKVHGTLRQAKQYACADEVREVMDVLKRSFVGRLAIDIEDNK